MNELIVFGKTLVAMVAGGIIGFEREKLHKYAGLRTHMLVCASTALLTGFSVDAYGSNDTTGRIVAGVITGIGFLCAGTIMSSNDGHITGLTSAATIWCTGIVGIVIGYGYYLLGMQASFLVVVTLLLKKVFPKY